MAGHGVWVAGQNMFRMMIVSNGHKSVCWGIIVWSENASSISLPLWPGLVIGGGWPQNNTRRTLSAAAAL